jgi:hypothetical protein
MTIAALCRVVAEGMGYKTNSSGMIARRRYQQGKPVDDTGFWVDPCDFMLCGNAMLEVLEWLQDGTIHDAFEVSIQSDCGAWTVYLNSGRSEAFQDGSAGDIHLPTAVLIAFMKAVRGVDVEVV